MLQFATAGESHGQALIAWLSGLPAGLPPYKLANGRTVLQRNRGETEFLYQEIFERRAYLQHGVTLEDGDCVFDVGANIGLFALFAGTVAAGVRIYSFEPIPRSSSCCG